MTDSLITELILGALSLIMMVLGYFITRLIKGLDDNTRATHDLQVTIASMIASDKAIDARVTKLEDLIEVLRARIHDQGNSMQTFFTRVELKLMEPRGPRSV